MSTVAWFWACGGLLSSARGHQLLGPSFLRDGSAQPASQRQPGLPAASSLPSVGLHPATIPPSVGVPPASVTAAPVNAEAFQGAGARVPRTSAPCALKAAPSTSRSRTSSLKTCSAALARGPAPASATSTPACSSAAAGAASSPLAAAPPSYPQAVLFTRTSRAQHSALTSLVFFICCGETCPTKCESLYS